MVMATGKGGGEREGKGIERSCKALNRTSDLGTKHIATQSYFCFKRTLTLTLTLSVYRMLTCII